MSIKRYEPSNLPQLAFGPKGHECIISNMRLVNNDKIPFKLATYDLSFVGTDYVIRRALFQGSDSGYFVRDNWQARLAANENFPRERYMSNTFVKRETLDVEAGAASQLFEQTLTTAAKAASARETITTKETEEIEAELPS